MHAWRNSNQQQFSIILSIHKKSPIKNVNYYHLNVTYFVNWTMNHLSAVISFSGHTQQWKFHTFVKPSVIFLSYSYAEMYVATFRRHFSLSHYSYPYFFMSKPPLFKPPTKYAHLHLYNIPLSTRLLRRK